MFLDCFLVEDFIVVVWLKFIFIVLFNRSLVFLDKLFGIEILLIEELCSGSLIGIFIDVFRLVVVYNVG